jgi:hypothetical protein
MAHHRDNSGCWLNNLGSGLGQEKEEDFGEWLSKQQKPEQ